MWTRRFCMREVFQTRYARIQGSGVSHTEWETKICQVNLPKKPPGISQFCSTLISITPPPLSPLPSPETTETSGRTPSLKAEAHNSYKSEEEVEDSFLQHDSLRWQVRISISDQLDDYKDASVLQEPQRTHRHKTTGSVDHIQCRSWAIVSFTVCTEQSRMCCTK